MIQNLPCAYVRCYAFCKEKNGKQRNYGKDHRGLGLYNATTNGSEYRTQAIHPKKYIPWKRRCVKTKFKHSNKHEIHNRTSAKSAESIFLHQWHDVSLMYQENEWIKKTGTIRTI